MRERSKPVLDLGLSAFKRFVAMDGTMLATVISAQAFTSLIPFLVVTSALSPESGDMGDKLIDQFNLTGASAKSMKALFASAGEVQSTVTWIGIIILILSALSFTRAVQRTFARAYEVDVKATEQAWRGLLWLFFMAVWVSTAVSLRESISDSTGTVVAVTVSSVIGVGFWLVTPLLLLGALNWRTLLPGAVACGIANGLFGVGSQIWIPIALTWSADRYGLIGVAFALQSWLLAYSFIMVGGAVFGATLAHRPEVSVSA